MFTFREEKNLERERERIRKCQRARSSRSSCTCEFHPKASGSPIKQETCCVSLLNKVVPLNYPWATVPTRARGRTRFQFQRLRRPLRLFSLSTVSKFLASRFFALPIALSSVLMFLLVVVSMLSFSAPCRLCSVSVVPFLFLLVVVSLFAIVLYVVVYVRVRNARFCAAAWENSKSLHCYSRAICSPNSTHLGTTYYK